MSGICSTYGNYKFWMEDLKGGDDLGIDERIILK
jgi:hypothetical protein